MANQAERHGARVDQVAAAQSIRVLMIVLVVPVALKLAGPEGSDVYQALALPVDAAGLLWMLAGSFVAGLVLALARIPNAWLLGPLAFAILLTATGYAPSALPSWLLVIGASLGARFSPEFLRGGSCFIAAVLASALFLLAACAGIGALIATISGLPLATSIVATARRAGGDGADRQGAQARRAGRYGVPHRQAG